VIAEASGHRRSDPQRLMDSREIVVHRADCNHSNVILDLLGETVCETSEAAHPHSHCQVVSLNVGRADMLGVRITADDFLVSADALGGTVSAHLGIGRCAVYLLQLRVFAAAEREETNVDKKTKRPYRANLSYSLPDSKGEQTSFWVETDDASRNQAEMWMNKYREQMLGEAVIGTDTIEHWNRINPKEEPLQFNLDFRDEAEWRRNVPVEEEELV
jgi:hypothetical protein